MASSTETKEQEQVVEDREEKETEMEKIISTSPEESESTILLLEPQVKDKKKDEVLNLGNEVVRMRKEVKRVRALVIRKMTRQMSALKKKKGKESDVERNQRRAARLLEEIHEMKQLKPDQVTKTALAKNISFEKVCKNPKSTISDRATARIATHPQFSKKIEAIKAAVKAFKEERMKGGKQAADRGKAKKQAVKEPPQPAAGDAARQVKVQEQEEDGAVDQNEMMDKEGDDSYLENSENTTIHTSPKKDKRKAKTLTGETSESNNKQMSGTLVKSPAVVVSTNVETTSPKTAEAKSLVIDTLQNRATEKPASKAAAEVQQMKGAQEESDLESSDEEKEYFDDSTEERFRKQSSHSEESDDEDDFFLGRVSKFKKKKSKDDPSAEERQKENNELKGDTTDSPSTSDQVPSERDQAESRLNCKANKLMSVFCSSLSEHKASRDRQSRGGGGQGNHNRGGQRGRGLNRFSNRPPKFQHQRRGAEQQPDSKDSNHNPERKPPKSEAFAGRGRGRGRGKGDTVRQPDRRGTGVFSHQAPQQALHPSWEASKKRKEQLGQILAFQGKKIKFDDDD
ncbi:serum response factor-binding protein 1 [Lampris incognitus]|uniref:serum response factor-binding protein 1 n=1 Tax=Lampris incognitus TaxID=2546036 RepID=UPI0024B56452|nr:serum response factor-binding protein 1 [Lampris incognitus]